MADPEQPCPLACLKHTDDRSSCRMHNAMALSKTFTHNAWSSSGEAWRSTGADCEAIDSTTVSRGTHSLPPACPCTGKKSYWLIPHHPRSQSEWRQEVGFGAVSALLGQREWEASRQAAMPAAMPVAVATAEATSSSAICAEASTDRQRGEAGYRFGRRRKVNGQVVLHNAQRFTPVNSRPEAEH